MSRLHANYYSCGKYSLATPAPADESVLYSQGRYKTKLTVHDMPPWYLRGSYYGYKDGFLCAKGIEELCYSPNLFTNHMFKDDFLFIRYKGVKPFPASDDDNFCPIPYNEYIWGWNIPRFLIWAEKYSGYDTSEIKQQIRAKQDWFRLTYPDDYAREVFDRDIVTWMDECLALDIDLNR